MTNDSAPTTSSATAIPDGQPALVQRPDGIDVSWADGRWLRATIYGETSIRVQAGERQLGDAQPELVIRQATNKDHDWTITTPGNGLAACLTRGDDQVTIDATGSIRLYRQGSECIHETSAARAFPRSPYAKPDDHFGASASFQIGADDALYGLGQFPDGVINWRHHQATLIHGNISIAIPMVISSAGWGLVWLNASHTDFRDDASGMRWQSEVADCIDYVLLPGGDFQAVTAAYRALTGGCQLFPRAFYGLIQSKERYRTAAELTDTVREARERSLPLDVIVQDWLYWGRGMHRWSCMRHDPDSYGDLPQAVTDIHDLHAQVMISIWPRIGQDSDLGKALAERNLLFTGNPSHEDKVYDAFDPEARRIYWQYVKDGLFDLDIDAWWMDGTEPEFEDCHETLRHKASAVRQRDTAAGSWARVLNAYSLATCEGVYEHQRAGTDRKRVFILTRSSFLGQQRNGTAVWSGDISATWSTFANQIPAGLNFCATGQPYWTTDNGGFFVRGRGATFPDGVDDPAFRELFVRWFQYSCFCPLMRSHGTQTPREIWQFGAPGEPIYDTLATFARLRSRLLPYTYSLAADTCFNHATPMRALGLVFPDDQRCHAIGDQFMYGDAFMACPVTVPTLHPPAEALTPFTPGELLDGDANHGALSMHSRDSDGDSDGDSQRVIAIDQTWAGNKPAGVSSDRYTVSFTGQLRVPAQPPELLLRIAGQATLVIDGSLVADLDASDGCQEQRLPMSSYAGRTVSFQLTYHHHTGDAVVQCGWAQTRPQTATGAHPGTRSVYLPSGQWWDFWTSQAMPGATTIAADAPLERLPVYVRAGAIVTLGPVQQWHNERPTAPWEIRIYPGTDGRTTIYEDAGNSYDYEQGHCSRIELRWDDQGQTLHIDKRHGSFDEMQLSRTFHVVVVGQGSDGCGISEPVSPRVVTYDGSATAVSCQTSL